MDINYYFWNLKFILILLLLYGVYVFAYNLNVILDIILQNLIKNILSVQKYIKIISLWLQKNIIIDSYLYKIYIHINL